MAGALLVGSSFRVEIVMFVLGEQYSYVADLLPVVIAATWTWLLVGVLSCAFTAQRWLWAQPIMNGLMLIITVGGVWLLVPRLGILGAVLSLIGGLLARGFGYLLVMIWQFRHMEETDYER
jgi:O-antigen/teichoic acid export membrane protein